ncbi:MAG: hypothetical protein EOP06_14910, partial [Proteobacteria bacterium]
MFLVLYIAVGCVWTFWATRAGGSSPAANPLLSSIFDVGAQAFLFVAGLELSLSKLKKDFVPAFKLSLGAFFWPFLMGLAIAPYITT